MGQSLPKEQESIDVQKQLLILADNSLSSKSELKRNAFELLRGKFVNRANKQKLFTAIAEIDSQRYALWDTLEDNYDVCDMSNKIRGLMFGAALGDSVGLNTEFLSKDDVERYYGNFEAFKPAMESIYPDVHRSMWVAGDWTDDTDQMLLLLISLLHTKGSADRCDLAKRMLEWHRCGFSVLNDESGVGLGATTKKVLNCQGFETHPFEAAIKIWESSGRKLAANGAIMRTAIVGVPYFWDTEKVVKNTIEFCRVTHASPECQASCVLITVLVAELLRQSVTDCSINLNASSESEAERRLIETRTLTLEEEIASRGYKLRGSSMMCLKNIRKLVHFAVNKSLETLEEARHILFSTKHQYQEGNSEQNSHHLSKQQDELLRFLPPFFYNSYRGSDTTLFSTEQEEITRLSNDNDQFLKCTLDLSEVHSIGYTYKCMGAALWGLVELIILTMHGNNRPDFHSNDNAYCRIIQKLVREGGDADTNATVCGAVLGCVCGYSTLPHDWIADMPYSSWLEAWVQKLLVMMRLK